LNLVYVRKFIKPNARDWDGPRVIFRRASCAVFGHEVDNYRFGSDRAPVKKCPCGSAILFEDNSHTRIAHVVSCFVRGHRYRSAGSRDGHGEYVCERCGHPLLFPEGQSGYAGRETFRKKVRYRCNLFGHRAHEVTRRDGLAEYACHCGHSFLREPQRGTLIRHPPLCLVAGHFVKFVTRRGLYAEFRCRNCGHTFCFVSDEARGMEQ
jgi:DNA-directed RNA polymerase subunit RPC12/RpoP